MECWVLVITVLFFLLSEFGDSWISVPFRKTPVTTNGNKLLSVAKPIEKIDLVTGEVLATYPSIRGAARQNKGSQCKIQRVLNGRSESHLGFFWRLVSSSARPQINHTPKNTDVTTTGSRLFAGTERIEKIDLVTGDVLAIYSSIGEAARGNNANRDNIIKVLNGCKTDHKGFFWRLGGSSTLSQSINAGSRKIVKLQVKAMSRNQEVYMDALNSSVPIIVVDGPAGTGKTFIACEKAARALNSGKVKKIVVTRPAVTTDEDLGYLPGDLEAKLLPYLLPIYDSFKKIGWNKEYLQEMIRKDKVEITPLSFMRGRTFTNCYVIADEMQNSTPEQMKMILTRLGSGSRMVITGDIKQSDLRTVSLSGLEDIMRRMDGGLNENHHEHIRLVQLENSDIVRHEAVTTVLSLYGDVN